jgi:hypothetical protein
VSPRLAISLARVGLLGLQRSAHRGSPELVSFIQYAVLAGPAAALVLYLRTKWETRQAKGTDVVQEDVEWKFLNLKNKKDVPPSGSGVFIFCLHATGLPLRSSGEQMPQQEPRAGKKVKQRGHYWCATCTIDCLDQLSFSMHMGGRKHRERVCVETRIDTEEFAQAKSRLDAEMSDEPATSSTVGQKRPVGAPTWDFPVQHWSKDPKPVAAAAGAATAVGACIWATKSGEKRALKAAAASRIESSGGASTTISTLVCCILHGAEIGQSADAVQQNQNLLITKSKSAVILDALRAVQTNSKMSLESGRTGLRPVVICSQRHCEGLLHLQEQRMLEQLPDGVDEEALVLRRALQEGAYILTNHHFHRYRDIVNVKWIKARCIRYSTLRTIFYTLYSMQ